MNEAEIAARIRASFTRQGLMATLGAELGAIRPGHVEIILRPHPAISQQHGFVHGGAVSAIADSAAGYAALSLMPPTAGVLTTDFTIHFLAPARGVRLVACGEVIKPGRTLSVVQTDVFAEDEEGGRRRVALLTASMLTVEGRPGVTD
jgi:uncharacterized protein (TIGR00369 family)